VTLKLANNLISPRRVDAISAHCGPRTHSTFRLDSFTTSAVWGFTLARVYCLLK
jgi:hypothetical protein